LVARTLMSESASLAIDYYPFITHCGISIS
jgi:hypothetical protein